MQSKELKILFFTNGTVSPKWRAEGIADRINKFTNHSMFVTPYNSWNGNIAGANIVVLQQLTGPHIVDEIHKQKAKAIFESDDAMIDSYGRERKNLQHLLEPFRGNAIETIRKCDASTVTNQVLKENYARFTKKPIYVLPNYIDYNWYGHDPLRIQRVDPTEVRIGWFGSRGHFEDLKAIMPALKTVIEKYPNVRLVYCGYGGFSSDKLVTEIGWGEDVFKEIPRERREFVLSVDGNFWPFKHRTLDLDIGISPLLDDYFNHCKTNIKWIEYSALTIPGVYSPVVYDKCVKDGKTGFLAKTLDDWINYLSILIEDSKLRRKMGKDAKYAIDKKWDLDLHWQKWIDLYSEILNS